MSHLIVTDLFGNRVSVYSWSLYVRASRYTPCDGVFVCYDIYAKKDPDYSDVFLKTPLFFSAEDALDYIDVLLSNASVQQEPGGDNSAG